MKEKANARLRELYSSGQREPGGGIYTTYLSPFSLDLICSVQYLHCVQSNAGIHGGGEETWEILQDLVRESASMVRGNVAEAVIIGAVGASLIQKRLGSVVEMLKIRNWQLIVFL